MTLTEVSTLVQRVGYFTIYNTVLLIFVEVIKDGY